MAVVGAQLARSGASAKPPVCFKTNLADSDAIELPEAKEILSDSLLEFLVSPGSKRLPKAKKKKGLRRKKAMPEHSQSEPDLKATIISVYMRELAEFYLVQELTDRWMNRMYGQEHLDFDHESLD